MSDLIEDPTLRLIERHASGRLGRDDILAELEETDPTLALMARLLTPQATVSSSVDEAGANVAPAPDQVLAETEGIRQLADGVRRDFDDLVADVESLRARLDTLAAALGACPGCWGDDRDCRWCRGRGAPGRLPPDPRAFDDWVMPAVRIEAQRRRPDAITVHTEGAERRTA